MRIRFWKKRKEPDKEPPVSEGLIEAEMLLRNLRGRVIRLEGELQDREKHAPS